MTRAAPPRLLLYVTHVALIAFVLDEWFEGRSLPEFLILYLALALSLWPLAWATQRARRWLATGPKKQTRAA